LDTSHFSPSQREVVETEEGPLSVLAGPGSGKTTVLVGRIAYLVDQRGVPPAAVLAITFTTAAAATLRQRLSSILGTTAQALTVTTFHALGLRLIKQWSGELGFGDYLPAVYGRDDARAVLREAATSLGLQLAPDVRQRDADPWALSLPKLDLAVERFRLGRTRAGTTLNWQDEFDEDLLRPLAETYEALLKERCAIDYPAMLSLPLRLFADEPGALHVVQNAYRFVMADEAAGEAGHGEDEERRLAYVAFSRTQVLLYLTYCQTRRHTVDGEPGRIETARPSRFLRSLPAGLIEHVERAWVA